MCNPKRTDNVRDEILNFRWSAFLDTSELLGDQHVHEQKALYMYSHGVTAPRIYSLLTEYYDVASQETKSCDRSISCKSDIEYPTSVASYCDVESVPRTTQSC